MTEWISVKDRLPPPNKYSQADPEFGCSVRVLVWYPRLGLAEDSVVTAFYDFYTHKWSSDENGPLPDYCQATHWMPLPLPPGEKDR